MLTTFMPAAIALKLHTLESIRNFVFVVKLHNTSLSNNSRAN